MNINEKCDCMDAIILAAGMGKRLKNLTKDKTKCMVEVNNVALIERMLNQLDSLNLNRIVIVVGYKSAKLIDFISSINTKTPIEYVFNEIYDKSNNIYSLFLAREYLKKSDCIILESDLIFEDDILKGLIEDEQPDLALVAKFESWMDGTVVTIDEDNNITNFLTKDQFSFNEIKNYYKTVNLYKFSKDFSQNYYVPFLEAYIKSLGLNEYYEQVLKVISLLNNSSLKVKKIDKEKWYEIDDVQDLDIAESIFARGGEKLEKYYKRFGGYWRYPHMIDFSFFVNRHYPPKTLISEIKSNFELLLVKSPSGMEVNSLLVSKYFNIDLNNICVGNGSSEIIKSLIEQIYDEDYKLGIIIPTYDEYFERADSKNIIFFDTSNNKFQYTANDIIHYFNDKNLSMLILINPDTPSGNYLLKNDVIKLIKWADENNIKLIVDESFIEFVDKESNGSVLDQKILNKNKNLIVIKSISQSFGVPGLRLGIVASGNSNLIKHVKKDLSIWNINSFAEFYLQIFEKYKSDYEIGLTKFKENRKNFMNGLNSLPDLNVLPSQANYMICEVKGNLNSHDLAEILLNKYNILIKDLSPKKGFENRSYIKIAIRDEEDNAYLIHVLNEILN